jgi:hypothetical protein
LLLRAHDAAKQRRRKRHGIRPCRVALEVIGGEETKLASALRLPEIERFAHIKKAADRFAEIGIEVIDSSLFEARDPELFKFIDFELPYY